MAFYSRDQITSILKCTAKYYYGIWSAPIKEDSDFQEYLMRGFELKRKKKITKPVTFLFLTHLYLMIHICAC